MEKDNKLKMTLLSPSLEGSVLEGPGPCGQPSQASEAMVNEIWFNSYQ